MLVSYSSDDVYNADETASMYRHTPQRRVVNRSQQENARKVLKRQEIVLRN
jgi:hypothetical protein